MRARLPDPNELRDARVTSRSAAPTLTGRTGFLLGLQASAGNRATERVVARLRREDEPQGPMDPEPDERAPAPGVGPAPSPDEEPVQLMVQRHRIATDRVGPPPPADQEPSGSSRSEGGRAAPAAAPAAPAAVAPTYPRYAAVTANATISGAASTAWQQTKDATSDGSRREQGFWIRWNSGTAAMSKAGETISPAVGNDTGATVSLGAKPADAADNFTVGSFHTHTPTKYRSVGRPIGASTEDGAADTSDNVTGLVYDYESPDASGTIPAKHPLNAAAHLWHSGPDRRT